MCTAMSTFSNIGTTSGTFSGTFSKFLLASFSSRILNVRPLSTSYVARPIPFLEASSMAAFSWNTLVWCGRPAITMDDEVAFFSSSS